MGSDSVLLPVPKLLLPKQWLRGKGIYKCMGCICVMAERIRYIGCGSILYLV